MIKCKLWYIANSKDIYKYQNKRLDAVVWLAINILDRSNFWYSGRLKKLLKQNSLSICFSEQLSYKKRRTAVSPSLYFIFVISYQAYLCQIKSQVKHFSLLISLINWNVFSTNVKPHKHKETVQTSQHVPVHLHENCMNIKFEYKSFRVCQDTKNGFLLM